MMWRLREIRGREMLGNGRALATPRTLDSSYLRFAGVAACPAPE